MFHRYNDGKAVFSWKEAEPVSDYIVSINFEERVKARLQKKRFDLPQVSEEVDAFFCNE